MSSLVAGTKYRGEFEEKINKLINEVENNEDIEEVRTWLHNRIEFYDNYIRGLENE